MGRHPQLVLLDEKLAFHRWRLASNRWWQAFNRHLPNSPTHQTGVLEAGKLGEMHSMGCGGL